MDEYEYRVEMQFIGSGWWTPVSDSRWLSELEALARFRRCVKLEDTIVSEGGQKRYLHRIVRRPVGAVTVYLEEGDTI